MNNYMLIVDDDDDDQFLLQQIFKKHSPDTTVEGLGNGEELLQSLVESQCLPRLVLLDINMPLMDGLEALQHIRSRTEYETLPIVMLTTSNRESDRQRANELNANGYFVKPGSLEDINQVVLTLKQQWL